MPATTLRRPTLDYPLLVVALALTTFGVLMVYSAGQTDLPSSIVSGLWKRQLAMLGLGLVAAGILQRAPVRLIEWAALPAYVGSTLLLLITLLFGGGAGSAASMKGWLVVAGVRLGQPSELAKITVVLLLAHVLASRRGTPRSLVELWQPLLVVAVPFLLIMAQPDLGTGLVFVGICFGMLFWAGVPWPLLVMLASPGVSLVLAFSPGIWGAWFLVLLALLFWYRPALIEGVALVVVNIAVGVIAPVLWDRLADFQKARLLVFLDPSVDPKASGYHVIQSQVAIGSGGITGKGFTLGTQKRLAFLPEQHTDFIFAVVGEELGFVGVSLALTLFLALFLRGTRIAQRAVDPFASLLAFGLISAWFVHVVVNVGMTLNLMPITGIPLPFFSYGPSFMIASWLAIALLLSVSAEGRGRPDLLGR